MIQAESGDKSKAKKNLQQAVKLQLPAPMAVDAQKLLAKLNQ